MVANDTPPPFCRPPFATVGRDRAKSGSYFRTQSARPSSRMRPDSYVLVRPICWEERESAQEDPDAVVRPHLVELWGVAAKHSIRVVAHDLLVATPCYDTSSSPSFSSFSSFACSFSCSCSCSCSFSIQDAYAIVCLFICRAVLTLKHCFAFRASLLLPPHPPLFSSSLS